MNPYKSYSFYRAFLFGIIVAILFHVSILLLAHKDEITRVVADTGAEIIRVEQIFLPPPPPPQEVVVPKKKVVRAKIVPNVVKDSVVEIPEPEPPPEPILVSAEALLVETPAAPEPAPVEIPKPVEPPKPTISKDSIQKVTKAYLVGIKKSIDSKKQYPATSRRLKQEGTVRVRFTVHRDGDIDQIYLAKGSDYSALDQSALEAVSALKSVMAIPTILNKDSWTIEIPIKYQLH